MTLDEILKPVKFVDEQILRQYTKLTKKWEDKGRNIYHLSSLFGLPSKFLILIGGSKLNIPIYLIELGLYNWDCGYNLAGLFGTIRDRNAKNEIVLNPVIEIYKKINRTVRLPTFLFGIGVVGRAGYDVINYALNGEPINNTTLNSLILGSGLLGISSSQYIKDSDPKILEKKPFYATLFEKIKEKLNSLVPSPLPVPVKANLEYRVD